MGKIITLENIGGTYHVPIPDEPQFESEILFAGMPVSEQYWRFQGVPKRFPSISKQNKFWEEEYIRSYVSGKWVAIKGVLHWIPPEYWFFLNHWKIDGAPPEFRMKRLKNKLFKWMIYNDERWKGSLTVKNRRDGETIDAMCSLVHKALPSEFALFGIQSTNLKAVKEVCWRQLMSGFKRLNVRWRMNSDGTPIFQGSTDAKTKLVLKRPAKHISSNTSMLDFDDEEDDQETEISYCPSGTEEFDGRKMREIALDELLKWTETDPLQAVSTYMECIMLGRKRVGLLNMFSSPVERKSKYTEDLWEYYKNCDPAKIDENTGVTKTEVARWFSDPLEGIESFYDKYGEADREEVHEHIIAKRMALPKHRRQAQVRKFPLNEDEAFGAYDSMTQWANKEGMEKRKIYLLNTDYKNKITEEKKYSIGSLHWKDQVPDNLPVWFQPNTSLDEFSKTQRFAFAFDPPDMPPLRNPHKPPKLIESVIGCDPYDYRNPTSKNPSMGAGVQFRFIDARGIGRVRTIDSMYWGRPHPDVFYEDMIKYCLYTQSMLQVEDKNRNIINYFEDRGYIDWIMPKDMWGDPTKKGNSPNAQTGFLDAICALIDALMSEPVNDEEYALDHMWLHWILVDALDFNSDDTQKSDITMALGQAVFGAQKWLSRFRRRTKSQYQKELADALAGYLF